LTQENVDRLMQGMRSKTEMAMDRVTASGEATGDKADQTIPPPPQGVDPKPWGDVMNLRPILQSGQPIPPANWAQAIILLRSNPTDALIEYFNAKAGPGFDGKEILQRLGGKAEAKGAQELLPGQTVTGTVPVREQEERPAEQKSLLQRLPQKMLPPELRGPGSTQ
jgi:hypothetical protein